MKKKIALIMILILLVPILVSAQQDVERVYKWFAEEKLTISNTVVQLSAEEYDWIYGSTRINVKDPNTDTWVLDEVVTEGTTGAMGILKGYSAAISPSYLDIEIKYNGLDSADFDANNTITGAGGGRATITGSYRRGLSGSYLDKQGSNCAIAEIHLLDNSIIWTRNLATPVYSATDASCVGRKQYEGDTFYLFGAEQIKAFKALRNSGSDAIIQVRYGR